MPAPLAAAVLIAASAAAAAAPASAVDAPLGVRTAGSFRELFLDVTGADARARGAGGLELRWLLANDWSTPTTFVRGQRRVEVQTDEQEDAVALALRLPWSSAPEEVLSRFATTLELRAMAGWGGFTDGLVSGWHHLVGFGDFGRQLAARDQIHVQLREADGMSLVDLSRGRAGLGDAVLRQQVLLAAGGRSFSTAESRWGVSVRLDVKLPLGRLAQLTGSGSADAGAALLGTCELLPWLTAHALLAASYWAGLPEAFPLRARRWHGTAEASLVAHRERWAFVIEDRVLTAAFEAGWTALAEEDVSPRTTAGFAMARAHNQITVGARWGPATLWFAEDFTPGDPGGTGERWFFNSNAPDIALGLTWAVAL